jgi:hypothetical protein
MIGFNPFSGVLAITAGTGRFIDAHGSLKFTAQAGPTAPFETGPGTIKSRYRHHPRNYLAARQLPHLRTSV